MEFDLASYLFLGSVPLVIALVSILKNWVSDTRLYPVFAIVLGIILNVFIAWGTGTSIPSSVLMGLIAGLMAAGIYSGVTTTTRKIGIPPEGI
jgi:hypothetical protein